MTQKKQSYIEAAIHLVFWFMIFAAVNVNWSADWFDKSLRPITPAPLSVVLFPFIFYAHAFWAIPKYLSPKKWAAYLLCFLFIFIVPEMLRLSVVLALSEGATFWGELESRDSLIFGSPSVFWLALTFSFAYRFTKDWFVKQQQIDQLGEQLNEHLNSKPQHKTQPLDEIEAARLEQKLQEVLRLSKPYLDPNLSLAALAQHIGTTDKKLSTLLNQNMATNFYDYLNSLRIVAFKKCLEEGKLENLSIEGLALQCGFKSKSSFYRAFKKETGISPTQYIQ